MLATVGSFENGLLGSYGGELVSVALFAFCLGYLYVALKNQSSFLICSLLRL